MTVERRYQMTRVDPGDYLLPSNDGTALFRLRRYSEHGDLEVEQDGQLVPVRGTFWAVFRWTGTPLSEPLGFARFREDMDAGVMDRWVDVEMLLPTRAAAIQAALR